MSHVHVEVAKNLNNAMENKLNLNHAVVFIFMMASFLSSSKLNAQVTLQEEPAITRLMQVFKSKNAQSPIIRAWRIQIITTSDRREMETAYKKFEMLYPQIDYQWEHNPPYYQVKIGAFEKKDDLESFLLELKREFPLSIPVQDDIEKKDLL